MLLRTISAKRGSNQQKLAYIQHLQSHGYAGDDSLDDYKKLLKGFTYLFEIIYPENRIVVRYGYEDLILLGVIDNKDGYEIKIYDDSIHIEGIRLRNLYNNLGFKLVKKYDGISDYSTLKKLVKDNEEGFVVKFSNGERVKIKGEEYLRLHKIMTNVSTTAVWEILSSGGSVDELLKDVPDEFYKKIKSYEKDLRPLEPDQQVHRPDPAQDEKVAGGIEGSVDLKEDRGHDESHTPLTPCMRLSMAGSLSNFPFSYKYPDTVIRVHPYQSAANSSL